MRFPPRQPPPPVTCQVTFQPALSRPDAETEYVILDGPSQAAILSRLQDIISKADWPFTTITLEFS